MAGFLSLFEQRKEKRKEPVCSMVVVAAGSATRMEGIDKMLAPMGELPVLVHTLYVFQDSPFVQEVVIATREDLLVEVSNLCRENRLDKVTKVVVGGATRTESACKGIRETRKDADLIGIHDGARPLVSQTIVRNTIEQARKTGAAAPGVPVTNTVKRIEGDLVMETVDRSCLREVQTPQVFEAGLIRAAMEKAAEEGVELTDDCAAVERLGMKVVLVPGSRQNIKITTPLDLILGEAILEARVKGDLPR